MEERVKQYMTKEETSSLPLTFTHWDTAVIHRRTVEIIRAITSGSTLFTLKFIGLFFTKRQPMQIQIR
jgi:hypothetical protein